MDVTLRRERPARLPRPRTCRHRLGDLRQVARLVALGLQRPALACTRVDRGPNASPGGNATSTIASHARAAVRQASLGSAAPEQRRPRRGSRRTTRAGSPRRRRPCRSRHAGSRCRGRRRRRSASPSGCACRSVIRDHLRQAGSENESDFALRCSTCRRRPVLDGGGEIAGRCAPGRSRSAGACRRRRARAPRPAAARDRLARVERSSTGSRPLSARRRRRRAAVAVAPGRLAAQPEPLRVDPDDRRQPALELRVERRRRARAPPVSCSSACSPSRSAVPRRPARAGYCHSRRKPSASRAVAASARTPTGCSRRRARRRHRGSSPRISGRAVVLDAEVGEHVGERGGVAVEAAAQLPRGVGVLDVAARDGVAARRSCACGRGRAA